MSRNARVREARPRPNECYVCGRRSTRPVVGGTEDLYDSDVCMNVAAAAMRRFQETGRG